GERGGGGGGGGGGGAPRRGVSFWFPGPGGPPRPRHIVLCKIDFYGVCLIACGSDGITRFGRVCAARHAQHKRAVPSQVEREGTANATSRSRDYRDVQRVRGNFTGHDPGNPQRTNQRFRNRTTDPSKSKSKSISLRPACAMVERRRGRSLVWKSRNPPPPAPTSLPPVAPPCPSASS